MDIIYEEPLYVNELSLKHVRVLGQGAYGFVSLEEHPIDGYYAKKISPIELKENLKKELRIMIYFRNHPRIVQATSHDLHLGIDDCYIYMEYASQGTLHDIISKFHRKPLPEYMIQRATRMILQGLEALHAKGYVHCDLKPVNVLVFPSKSLGEPWDLKLSDFGSAKEPNTDHSRLCSTLQYMSPECFWENPPIDPELDIWSLGCVVYEMFGGKYVPDVYIDSCEWRLFQAISPVAKDFLKRCHELHPARKEGTTELSNHPIRATASELLNHPFITQRLDVPLPIPTTRQQQDWPTTKQHEDCANCWGQASPYWISNPLSI